MFEYLGKKVRCPRKLKKRLKKQHPFGLTYLYYFPGIQIPSYSMAEITLANYITDMLERMYHYGPTIDFNGKSISPRGVERQITIY